MAGPWILKLSYYTGLLSSMPFPAYEVASAAKKQLYVQGIIEMALEY